MAGIHIRDVSDETVSALKRRAKAHHRSVQGEIRAILAEAARSSPPADGYPEIRLHHVDCGGDNDWPRTEMYDEDGR